MFADSDRIRDWIHTLSNSCKVKGLGRYYSNYRKSRNADYVGTRYTLFFLVNCYGHRETVFEVIDVLIIWDIYRS